MSSNTVASSGAIDHNDLLTPVSAQSIGCEARDYIRGTSSRSVTDDCYCLIGVGFVLRMRSRSGNQYCQQKWTRHSEPVLAAIHVVLRAMSAAPPLALFP